MLAFRAALEATRIYNHYAKGEKGEEKKAATARIERLIRRALAQDWSVPDFEREAARAASTKTDKRGRVPAAPVVFELTATRLVVFLDRLADETIDMPTLEMLAGRLEALTAEIKTRLRPEA